MKFDIDILDVLKTRLDFRTDVELAGFLNVKKSIITQIRHSEMKLSFNQKLTVMDHLGFIKGRDLLTAITSEALTEKILQASYTQSERLALPETVPGVPDHFDIVLIELFKQFGKFKSDKEVASCLGVNRTMITTVRAGRRKLGPLPRLRMLKFIEKNTGIEIEDIESLERAIESSEYLFEFIKDHMNTSKKKSDSPE